MGDNDSNFTVNYFLPHIAPGRVKKEYPADDWRSSIKCREIQLLNNFLECFCDSEDKLKIDAVKKRYEFWKSKEFFEKIRYMPLLAMYIFYLIDYYQKSQKEIQDPCENIDQEIFDARDMAEGLLQILENIYHSEYQRGYFCFRIHSNTPKRSGEYLKKEYSTYMEEQNRKATASTNYLEMKVADFSHYTIPMQFYKGFSRRMERAAESEKVLYKKIRKNAAEVKVASFYNEETEFWQQYNSLSENVIHHYGIQIFQSLIACYQGYFRVQSQNTEDFISEKDFYSTHPDNLKNTVTIPGTQYDALIPLGMQNMMQNISMDVNLRYDNYLIDQYKVCENEIKFNAGTIRNVLSAKENKLPFQERKELSVHRLTEKLEDEINIPIVEQDKKYILHFSAKNIMITAAEIFCKTLMLYIARTGKNRDCYIMINNFLFHNAALVLHFDADKEFRMNVKTKYSFIQQLYDNLCTDNVRSVINFHYIDDTIISGRTYQRMKSLICSLINQRENSMVEINIFKSVVLLLSRMSASSVKDYIKEPQYFMAYFKLNISSMRVNSDACVLCKKYEEWSKLSEQASLNNVYTFWKEKSRRIKCIPIEEFETTNIAKSIKYPDRKAQYMVASHRAKELLDDICSYAGIDEIIEQIVEELFPEGVFPAPDELIAVLKILGRPFMTFRREEKEAVFKLMLIMTDMLLNEEKPEGKGKLQKILRDIHNDYKIHIIMVTTLINRLAELESNYIIRKKV